MAKTGVFDSDPISMVRAAELKKELQKLVNSIVDHEDYRTETIDQANDTLRALKELRAPKQQENVSAAAPSCPEEFKCPLSKELMRDPVILCTGQVSESRLLAFFQIRFPLSLSLLFRLVDRKMQTTWKMTLAVLWNLLSFFLFLFF
ncbi:unnamed protein product [Linum tenue]|uniref:U-box domain-containing protein n=1 Tax=Linum tenue TaxID=586396 RepID=A0AAV0QZ78_9ROSI|nr:unnamed protein product [Linum tenue]